MAKNNQKTYWPHMIVGFLMLAFTLSFWTVKSASSIPVQEVNNYMLKYQQADLGINEILARKKAFDADYAIQLTNAEILKLKENIHSKVPSTRSVKLSNGSNTFTYTIKDKQGSVVNDANVSFLLTRPHTRKDDKMIEHVPFVNGMYTTEALELTKPGRYTLQLRAIIGDKIGYSEIEAYLKP